MANELYNNTYEKDITDNILLKTGLDYSEIAMLLASQVSNCVKLVLRGQRIWIEQVTALAIDLSNKECFEASISYTYCGRTLVYKAKLNISYAPNCIVAILESITFASGSFTIVGQIPNSYLEYSTDGAGSWIRLPTPFADTTSITTSALPTNIDLKVRMVAVCDETKISNILDYDYVVPVVSYGHNLSVQSSGNFITACTFTDLQLLLYGADSNVFSVGQFFTDANLTIPYNGNNEFRKATSGVISQTLQIDSGGFVVSIEGCA